MSKEAINGIIPNTVLSKQSPPQKLHESSEFNSTIEDALNEIIANFPNQKKVILEAVEKKLYNVGIDYDRTYTAYVEDEGLIDDVYITFPTLGKEFRVDKVFDMTRPYAYGTEKNGMTLTHEYDIEKNNNAEVGRINYSFATGGVIIDPKKPGYYQIANVVVPWKLNGVKPKHQREFDKGSVPIDPNFIFMQEEMQLHESSELNSTIEDDLFSTIEDDLFSTIEDDLITQEETQLHKSSEFNSTIEDTLNKIIVNFPNQKDVILEAVEKKLYNVDIDYDRTGQAYFEDSISDDVRIIFPTLGKEFRWDKLSNMTHDYDIKNDIKKNNNAEVGLIKYSIANLNDKDAREFDTGSVQIDPNFIFKQKEININDKNANNHPKISIENIIPNTVMSSLSQSKEPDKKQQSFASKVKEALTSCFPHFTR